MTKKYLTNLNYSIEQHLKEFKFVEAYKKLKSEDKSKRALVNDKRGLLRELGYDLLFGKPLEFVSDNEVNIFFDIRHNAISERIRFFGNPYNRIETRKRFKAAKGKQIDLF